MTGGETLHLCWTAGGRRMQRAFDAECVTLGRYPACDLVLNDESVSREHAQFRREAGGWFVRDLGAKNHVLLNGKRVEHAQVRHGDVVTLGQLRLACGIGGELTAPVQRVVQDPLHYTGQLTEFRQMNDLRTLLGESAAHDPAAESSNKFRGGAWVVRLFHDAMQPLLSGMPLERMFDEVLRLTFDHVPAERGVVCLHDPRTKTSTPKAVRTAAGQDPEVRISETIARTAIEGRRSVLFHDKLAPEIQGGLGLAHSILSQSIHSAMCAPLCFGERIVGFIYVDTRSDHQPFRPEHLDVLSTLAMLLSMAAEHNRSREIRERLARYSSPNVVEQLIERVGTQASPEMLAQEAEITVLFADLSGFTALARRLDPPQVTRILNDLFERLTGVVFEHGGTLDKYIGDELMAFWGAPLAQPDHALRAVRAALRMQELLLEATRQSPDAQALRMRIGLNSGPAVVGDIGSRERRDYTVIGAAVNLAKRLQALAAQPGDVVIGPATEALLAGQFRCERLEPVTLKGLEQALEPFRVVGSAAAL